MKLKNNTKHNDVISLIGPGVEIEGEIKSQGSIRIDGYVKGDVLAEGDVVIGDSGEIYGTIKGKNITMGGKVSGALASDDKLVLEANAELNGDLISKILVIEAGAKFDGKSSMTANGTQKPEEKPQQQQHGKK